LYPFIIKKDAEMTQSEDNEKLYLTEILKMTGREERLTRIPLLTEYQKQGFKNVLASLIDKEAQNRDYSAKCDLFNRSLLILGIKPVRKSFFEVVFENTDFSNIDQVKLAIKRFRVIAMLEYGSFRFAYKILKFGEDKLRGITLKEIYETYFPDGEKLKERNKKYNDKVEPIGLRNIPPSTLFVLGYLAGEQSKRVNDARVKLKEILEDALTKQNMKNFADLKKLAEKHNEKNLNLLATNAEISGMERLLLPSFYAPNETYSDVIEGILKDCISIDQDEFDQARKNGSLNTTTYLGLQEIDAYLATSMRDPLHFTTNHAFIESLFSNPQLKDWKIHYFDPTQSYMENRIEKGLVESLMIKRSKVTIYNAQESDTFGKDSEAAVALAQGKEVIVYVSRLFSKSPEFKELYEIIDKATEFATLDELVNVFVDRNFLTSEESKQLLVPGKSKGDAIELVSSEYSNKILSKFDELKIATELMYYGYDPEWEKGSPASNASKHISKLERRALTFKDVHPLSFQVSALDGVARGVIVTRSVDDTAQVLKGLLVGNLSYDITEDDSNAILLEQKTRSPMRVVTKEPTLTTSFWSEFSRETRN
jgi:hypothetical protein